MVVLFVGGGENYGYFGDVVVVDLYFGVVDDLFVVVEVSGGVYFGGVGVVVGFR